MISLQSHRRAWRALTYTTDAARQLLIFKSDWAHLAMDFAFVGILAVVTATIGGSFMEILKQVSND